MRNRVSRSATAAALAVSVLVVLGGCAKASVEPTMRANRPLPQPDMILVNDFAVSPSEVKLDQGVMASAVRDAGERAPNEEESKVGHMVAEKLAQSLVEELRAKGIKAARAGSNVTPSETTGIVNGQFVTVDQGNQSARVWVGFGLGGSELRTRVQISQGGQLVAQAETATRSNLKPGMLTSLGAGAAAGSAATVAVGAAGTGVTEGFTATVEADAKRTAKEVANKIHQAYVDRGWLSR